MPSSNNRDAMDIVRFYRDEIPSWSGKWLKDIYQYDDMRLEHAHDYIQWLFPIEEPIYLNLETPKLTDEVIQEFHFDEKLRDRLEESFIEMLGFWGLDMEKFPDSVVVVFKKNNYDDKKIFWQTGKNHNMLRITRVLHSLQSLGLRLHAVGFYVALMDLVKENPSGFNETSIQFWRDAMKKIPSNVGD